MSILNENIINFIKKNNLNRQLLVGNFGIEKENLRVKFDGELSLTPHPIEFGEKIKNPYIKTDFSESQVEVITPTLSNIEETYNFLKDLNNIVSLELKDELLWPQSSPSRLMEDSKIPLADFGPTGTAEKEYRETLSEKYGRKNQLISGIHYNFSFSDKLIDKLYEEFGKDLSYKEFKDNIYLKVTKKLLKYRWLNIYLTGASPVVHSSHDERCISEMETEDGESYFLKDSLSFRNGKFGYKNKKKYIISYDSVQEYVQSIEDLVESKELSDPRELYSSIRLRAKDNNDLLNSLKNDGITYLEIRHIDLNPFEKEGISLETLYLTHMFVIYSLLSIEEDYDEDQQIVAYRNHELAVDSGLKEHLEIYETLDKKVLMSDAGERVLEDIRGVVELIDMDKDFLNHIIDDAIEKVKDPKKTLAYKVLDATKDNNYLDFHINKAKQFLEESKKEEYKMFSYEDLELSTQILLRASIKRGVKFDLIDRSDNFVLLDNGEKKEYVKQGTKTSVDTYSSVMVMENKVVTKEILDRAGIRIPKGRDYVDVNEAKEDYSYFNGKRIVVKPKSTNFGIGITIFKNEFSKESYERAVAIAFENDNSIIIEEFLNGDEYRFLVMGDKIEGILNRVPANVSGDGVHSIRELVEEKNKHPLRGENYAKPLEKIKLGESEKMFLESQQKDFDYVPNNGETIFLRENSNVSTGGDSIDYTDIIRDEYKKIAIECTKIVGAKICGVDMMIEDINAAPTDDNYGIIELNFNPAIHIHSYPYKGKNRKIGDKILDILGM